MPVCACAGACAGSQPGSCLDPAAFNWSAAYTAYPQGPLLAGVQDVFTCAAPNALCSNANCSVVPGTTPLIDECGCVAFPEQTGLSLGKVPWMLDAQYKAETVDACGNGLGLAEWCARWAGPIYSLPCMRLQD